MQDAACFFASLFLHPALNGQNTIPTEVLAAFSFLRIASQDLEIPQDRKFPGYR